MGKRAFTPGPWTVNQAGPADDEDFIFRAVIGPNMGGGIEVAIVTTGSYSDDVEAANACLIAAAPELLEALRALAREASPLMEQWGPRDRRALDAARAAIARAEGRA